VEAGGGAGGEGEQRTPEEGEQRTLEMRVTELEDKLAKMRVAEEQLTGGAAMAGQAMPFVASGCCAPAPVMVPGFVQGGCCHMPAPAMVPGFVQGGCCHVPAPAMVPAFAPSGCCAPGPAAVPGFAAGGCCAPAPAMPSGGSACCSGCCRSAGGGCGPIVPNCGCSGTALLPGTGFERFGS
jgi:hypothetical protein